MSQGLDNRWLVKLSSDEAAGFLVRSGLHLYNLHIQVRYYDDVLAEEYSEYLKFVEYWDRLHQTGVGILQVARGLDQDQ